MPADKFMQPSDAVHFDEEAGPQFPSFEGFVARLRQGADSLPPDLRAALDDEHEMAGLWQHLWRKARQKAAEGADDER